MSSMESFDRLIRSKYLVQLSLECQTRHHADSVIPITLPDYFGCWDSKRGYK